MDGSRKMDLSPEALVQSARGLVTGRVFEAAVQKTRIPMALSDPNLPDCPLVFVNPAFEKTTGYTAMDVVGKNCRFLQGADTDPDSIRRIREAVAAGESINETIYNYRRDGSGFWNALYVSPVRDDNGRITYFFASQIDVSEEREAARRQARRIETVGALASGVAHEFNSLMTIVLGGVERAMDPSALASQGRNLGRADQGARRAGQLAARLLTLTQREVANDLTVDLAAFLRNALDSKAFATPQGIDVSLEVKAGSTPVTVDAAQLEKVLVGLIANSSTAMPAGGTVRLSVRTSTNDGGALRVAGREAIELAVADNGHGMSADVLARATELFFTTGTESGALGMGLFLALEFVERAGGRLLIDSTPGTGTVVRLLFPRARWLSP